MFVRKLWPDATKIHQAELMIFQVDVGQNGRPSMGPQMEMSSLVLTIQLLGYLILNDPPSIANMIHPLVN